MMTRKDYIAAAKIVAMHYATNDKAYKAAAPIMEDAFCEFFHQDNPRFDETRFRDYCRNHLKYIKGES